MKRFYFYRSNLWESGHTQAEAFYLEHFQWWGHAGALPQNGVATTDKNNNYENLWYTIKNGSSANVSLNVYMFI